jgi:predicted TIM-barrel fold metal-dependent hydrolase
MREYRLVSGDSHVLEPPDLWTSRVPERFRERAPHLVRLPQGDAWIIEGALDPINFGLNQCGGYPLEKRVGWIRWEDVRRAGYDPAARLAELDQDGVDADILYPTPRLANGIFWNTADPELQVALIRAYNDWLSEFCSHAPERFVGLAMIPGVGTETAIEELRRAMRLPGMRGAMLGRYPSGGEVISPADEPFWAEVAAVGVPLDVHVSFANDPPADHRRARGGTNFRFFDAPVRAIEFIEAGVFDRYPNLSLVFAEVDCGWVPYVKEQLDDRYQRRDPRTLAKIALKPSAYFERNMYFVFITDRYGIENRHKVGVRQMLWSSDYPHQATDWPNSWPSIERHFRDVPAQEKHAILAGNAVRLYGLRNGI